MAAVNYLSAEKLAEAGITWDELSAIKKDFELKIPSYEQAAQTIANVLLKTPGVHSVRYRVKDPRHLLRKIVRKRLADRNRDITIHNYEQELTDLSGVRVLHLFKSDWRRIHRFITETWELKEMPTAYYRKGDPTAIQTMFGKMQCEVKEHPAGYRSVHYLIETAPTRVKRIVEIQVRTIFEEGWSEVDHKLRYPDFSDDPLTGNLLSILNRLAGSADEMSSFVQELHSHLLESKEEVDRLQQEHEEKVKQMQRVIDELNLPDPDKSKLQGAAESLGRDYNFDLTVARRPAGSWMDDLNRYVEALETKLNPTAGAGDFLNYLAFSNIARERSNNSGTQGREDDKEENEEESSTEGK